MADGRHPQKTVGSSGVPVLPPYSNPGVATAPPMQTGYPMAQIGAAFPHHPVPQGPPPPYSAPMSQPGYAPYPSAGYQYGYPMYAQGPVVPPGATVVMQDAFDAGARFNSSARPTVPPPPPGVMPNAAQVAMMQGNHAVLGQQKSSFLSGGGADAGYTVW